MGSVTEEERQELNLVIDVTIVGGYERHHIAYFIVAELIRRGLPVQVAAELRKLAVGFDPMWRDVAAALSVGPSEFGQFMTEATLYRMKFHRRLNEIFEERYPGGELKLKFHDKSLAERVERFLARCDKIVVE